MTDDEYIKDIMRTCERVRAFWGRDVYPTLNYALENSEYPTSEDKQEWFLIKRFVLCNMRDHLIILTLIALTLVAWVWSPVIERAVH